MKDSFEITFIYGGLRVTVFFVFFYTKYSFDNNNNRKNAAKCTRSYTVDVASCVFRMFCGSLCVHLVGKLELLILESFMAIWYILNCVERNTPLTKGRCRNFNSWYLDNAFFYPLVIQDKRVLRWWSWKGVRNKQSTSCNATLTVAHVLHWGTGSVIQKCAWH